MSIIWRCPGARSSAGIRRRLTAASWRTPNKTERERERERERETDRQTDRKTERERERETRRVLTL